MRRGDLVVHRLLEKDEKVGIVLRVDVDQSLMTHRWAVPWKYTVMWNDGTVKIHEMGVLGRIRIYETR